MFARRTNWKLSPNQISIKLDELRKRGARILNLTQSNPTEAGLSYPRRILNTLGKNENLRYTPDAKGLLAARRLVGKYYAEKGVLLSPDQIILTASTSESYSYLFRLLCEAGDEVLTPSPGYPLLEFLGSVNDVTARPYHFEYLKSSITGKTRAILLVHPNNPTGDFVKVSELAILNELAQKHNLALISDEVFLDFAYSKTGPRRAPTFASNHKTLTFTLGGISKMLALPQMKLGWIAVTGPEKLKSAAIERLEVIADTYLSVSAPVQNAFSDWMKSRKAILKNIMSRLVHNRKFLERNIEKISSCQLLPAEGGWYAVIRIPAVHTEEEWVLRLLEQDQVLVQPGYFYDFPEEAYLVVSLLAEPKIFEQGVEKLIQRIRHESA